MAGFFAVLSEKLRKIGTAVLGHWQWQPPAWIVWTARQILLAWRFLLADWRRAAALLLLLIGSAAGYRWYKTRPIPHYVEYTLAPPELTEYDDNGSALVRPFVVTFEESAAPLKFIGKPVSKGVDLSPAIPGTWSWTDDKQLVFKPKNDWPVDGHFQVKLAKKGLLAPGVELEDYKFEFQSQPFTAKIASGQFYQDPVNPNMKKLVATVHFSHPVDPRQFEQHVNLTLAKDALYLGLKQDSTHFTVAYDKFKLNAYVHSSPLDMPIDDTPMTLTIDKGVRAARGGNDTNDKLTVVVTIPGRTSLKFSGAEMTVVDNARYEPEQVLLLKSSSPVAEKALAGKVAMCLLPERSPAQNKDDPNPYAWDSPEQVGNDILPKCASVPLTYVPSEEGGNTSHGFKFRAPVGRYVYLSVRDGIEGIGGYIAGQPYIATFKVDPYPQKLTFLGQGALLPLSGDKKVGFLTRDVSRVEIEIGRVLPNQVQHLAPEMWSFSHPSLDRDL